MVLRETLNQGEFVLDSATLLSGALFGPEYEGKHDGKHVSQRC